MLVKREERGSHVRDTWRTGVRLNIGTVFVNLKTTEQLEKNWTQMEGNFRMKHDIKTIECT